MEIRRDVRLSSYFLRISKDERHKNSKRVIRNREKWNRLENNGTKQQQIWYNHILRSIKKVVLHSHLLFQHLEKENGIKFGNCGTKYAQITTPIFKKTVICSGGYLKHGYGFITWELRFDTDFLYPFVFLNWKPYTIETGEIFPRQTFEDTQLAPRRGHFQLRWTRSDSSGEWGILSSLVRNHWHRIECTFTPLGKQKHLRYRVRYVP